MKPVHIFIQIFQSSGKNGFELNLYDDHYCRYFEKKSSSGHLNLSDNFRNKTWEFRTGFGRWKSMPMYWSQNRFLKFLQEWEHIKLNLSAIMIFLNKLITDDNLNQNFSEL